MHNTKMMILILQFFVPCMNLSAQQEIENLLSSIRETSLQDMKSRWDYERLSQSADLVVIARFQSSMPVQSRQPIPVVLKSLIEEIESIESSFLVLAVLKKTEYVEADDVVALIHYRFRQLPRFASKPPHFLNLDQSDDSQTIFLLFLKRSGRGEYYFVAGDYFAHLSVRKLSEADSITQFQKENLTNSSKD